MGIKIKLSFAVATIMMLLNQPSWADDEDRRQAKRIHDRLTGVPATNAAIDAMETRLIADPTGKTAAEYAIDTALNPNARYFYNVTLKNFSAPWTNEEQTVFTPLNDYSATVIGLIRDGADFRRVLYDNVIYRGFNGPAYSNSNNNHYEQLEALGPVAGDLSDPAILVADTQTAVTGLPGVATAGIMTTRAGAMSFFSDGTNRAMFRFTLMNHLCTDLEPLKDISRTPDRIRQDVSRSPGGDSRIFLNSCIGCHAGMDGMTGAFAYYEWDYTNDISDGQLVYRDLTNPKFDPVTGVSLKHHINPDNFEPGYRITDDSWVNYWRNGQNWLLGWGPALNPDSKGNETGNGAKSMGQELANSDAFAQCQVDKVFETICLRSPTEFYGNDRAARDTIVADFKTTYNLRDVFTDVAAHCKGN